MTPPTAAAVLLTERFAEAAARAVELHGSQRRKLTGVSFLEHLLGELRDDAAAVHGSDADVVVNDLAELIEQALRGH
jgi:hypothetical protein